VSLARRTPAPGAEFFSIWVAFFQGHTHTGPDLIAFSLRSGGAPSDRMLMAYTVDDIERAHKQKKLASRWNRGGPRLRMTSVCCAISTAGRALYDADLVDTMSGPILPATSTMPRSSTTTADGFRQASSAGDECLGMMVDISHVGIRRFMTLYPPVTRR